MKVIDASVQEIKQAPGLIGIYKHIERCGRTCYKSEDKITEDSAKDFFQRLVNRKHYAMLEHGTVYLRIPCTGLSLTHRVVNSKYSFVNEHIEDRLLYVTTNMRVLIEEYPNDYEDIIKKYALEEPDVIHIKRVTAHFIISRGIANEFVRHRVFSFAQESTRYCNYCKDKFDGELIFIKPEWLNGKEDSYSFLLWIESMSRAEFEYKNLCSGHCSPQDARGFLPLDLKTELIMTGTTDQWEGFFDLRMREVSGPAHPDAKAIATKWYNIIK